MDTENTEVESAEVEQAPESMLDSSSPELTTNEYFLQEGVKGIGDKPEWYLSDKYTSVAEQAKGYSELQKRFGSFTGAPKDGYQLPEGFDKEDALVSEVLKFGEETNMHQDGVNRLLDLAMKQAEATEQVKVETEMKKLGDNANGRIKTVENFLKNKMGKEYDSIAPMINSAESVQLVEAMIKATQPARLPIDGDVEPGGLTMADIEKEMFRKDENGNMLRSVSREHEAKVQRLLKEFGGDRPNMRVIG